MASPRRDTPNAVSTRNHGVFDSLPIQREWFKDGPFTPVEFTRQSSDGRITLVIDPTASPVRLLWAHMLSPDLASAKQALRDREGITAKEWEPMIGAWQHGAPAPAIIPDLERWADAHGLDAAIWTALGPKLDNREASPQAPREIMRSSTLSERHARSTQSIGVGSKPLLGGHFTKSEHPLATPRVHQSTYIVL